MGSTSQPPAIRTLDGGMGKRMNQDKIKLRSSSTLTLLRAFVTSSPKFANRSVAIAVPPLWNKLTPVLRKISDPSYELTQTAQPHLFHLSTALSLHTETRLPLFSKSYPDSSSTFYNIPPSPSELQTPPTIAVCLTACMTLCLSSLFLSSICE